MQFILNEDEYFKLVKRDAVISALDKFINTLNHIAQHRGDGIYGKDAFRSEVVMNRHDFDQALAAFQEALDFNK